MARVNHVNKAATDQGTCSKCGVEIKKGDAYVWTKNRYGPKRKRCTATACRFRSSDLTSSEKLSQVYEAQETAEDAVAEWTGDEDDASDVTQALQDAAEQIREVAQEYQQSADAIRDNFAESTTADECEEKANDLESWADELDAWEPPSDFDEAEARKDAIEALREEYEPPEDSVPRPHEVTREQWVDHPQRVEAVKKLREAFEPDEDDIDTKVDEFRQEWVAEVREAAESTLSDCPV
jgi:DNA repair ATPase RecN